MNNKRKGSCWKKSPFFPDSTFWRHSWSLAASILCLSGWPWEENPEIIASQHTHRSLFSKKLIHSCRTIFPVFFSPPIYPWDHLPFIAQKWPNITTDISWTTCTSPNLQTNRFHLFSRLQNYSSVNQGFPLSERHISQEQGNAWLGLWGHVRLKVTRQHREFQFVQYTLPSHSLISFLLAL